MYHSNMLNAEKTRELIEEFKITVEKETIDLKDGNSRILAQEIIVMVDVPPFNRSAMDGYAIIADDVSTTSESNPKYLEIVDEVGAGSISNHHLKLGEAIQIATGAQMPSGADAIIMEEDIESYNGKIKVESPVSYNNDVALIGEDLKKGEIILSEGQILGPHHLSVIASAGYKEITVFKKPDIGVIITGNELVEPSINIKPGMIINSNKYALYGVIEDSKAVSYVKQCPDNKEELMNHVIEAVKKYDAVITTGGTAISKGDLIVGIVEELGEVRVHGVSMKPGKPFGFGIVDKTPVFMLSGYPVAVAVQYDMFVRNFILKLQNIHKKMDMITVIAGENVRSSPDKYNVIRANFKEDEGIVYPIRTKAGINKSVLMSNCYIIAEEGVGMIKKGEKCNILKYSSLKVC
ncbi:MAG: gephyrin-like molybdotransferase Glp [Methanobacterium sp.]|uniref:molybdopterin molybdotransferase MoeA n=1 Tax=Methanobacterium sp. TaxID=2164 RepID=UPI003C70F590